MTNKPVDAPDEETVEEVPPRKPSPMGSTFAERAAARQAAGKQVDNDAAENKAVSAASTKSRKSTR